MTIPLVVLNRVGSRICSLFFFLAFINARIFQEYDSVVVVARVQSFPSVGDKSWIAHKIAEGRRT